MAAVKVRDCPCCGQPGKLKSDRVKTIGGSFLRGWVGCPACSLYIQWARDPEGAIAKWNRRVIAEAPAADVVEVQHGEWINERWEGLSSFSAECSLCGKRTLAYFHYSYCPNCGAKMDGGQNDG